MIFLFQAPSKTVSLGKNEGFLEVALTPFFQEKSC